MCQIFNVKKLDPPAHQLTHVNLTMTQTVGRFDMRESDSLPENFVIVLQLSNHKINREQLV